MTTDGRPATLRDIAALCQVSVPTVSKVLNGRGTVSPETHERIMAAVAQLDFQPNGLAKAFALGRSYTVGILAQNAASALASRVITGMMAELSRHDIAVLVYDDEDDPSGLQNSTARLHNVRTLQARRVDGVIVVSDGNDQTVASVSGSFDCPVVNVYSRSTNPADTCFIPDDESAGYKAAQHLVGLGRKRIAHITGQASSQATQERVRGVSRALRENSLRLALGSPWFGNWSTHWGTQAAGQLIERIDEFDAIVCGNDYIALGIARVFERAGIRIPDDIALIGYDNRANHETSINHDHFLTSMEPHLNSLGRVAAQALVATDSASRPEGIVYQPVDLIPGISSGALPAGEPEEFVYSL